MTADAQAIVFVMVWPIVLAAGLAAYVRMGDR